MLLSKKEQYFKIISDKENKKFFNGFASLCLACSSLIAPNSDYYATLASIILLLFFFATAICGLFFSISLLFCIYSFVYQEKYELAIFSFFDGISFIITFLGCFGKVKCFCLYRPYQWIFFMVLWDLIHIISDSVLFILLMHRNYYTIHNDFAFYMIAGFLGSICYSIAFTVMHFKIGGKLIILFKSLKNLETNVIKFCVLEYIKELKNNPVLDEDILIK